MTDATQALAPLPRVSPPEGTPAIITYANQKGGVGKTALAVAYAAAGARAGNRTLAVDADERQRSLDAVAEALGNRAGFDFNNTSDLANDDATGEERQRQIATQLQRFRTLRGLIDLIVFDTPGNLDHPVIEAAMAISDLVIIPCIPERLSYEPTLNTIDVVAGLGVPFRVVLTQCDPLRGPQPVQDMRELLTAYKHAEVTVLDTVIRRYVAWPQSMLDGVVLPDYRGDRSWRNAVSDLMGMYAEVAGILLRQARA